MLITDTKEQLVLIAALNVALATWRGVGGDPTAPGVQVAEEILKRFEKILKRPG